MYAESTEGDDVVLDNFIDMKGELRTEFAMDEPERRVMLLLVAVLIGCIPQDDDALVVIEAAVAVDVKPSGIKELKAVERPPIDGLLVVESATGDD